MNKMDNDKRDEYQQRMTELKQQLVDKLHELNEQ